MDLLNRIGIAVDVKSTGGEGARRSIEQLRELSQFESLTVEAASKFPGEIEKQNKYLRDQLNILKQIENVGFRKRIIGLQEEQERSSLRSEKVAIGRQIEDRRRSHDLANLQLAESELNRRQLAGDLGIGVGGGDESYVGGIAGDLLAGGVGGTLATNRTKVLSRLRGAMKGASTGAKFGVGLAATISAMLGIKFYKHLKEGGQKFVENVPELTRLMTYTGNIPQGTKAELEFNRNLYETSAIIGESIEKTIQLEQEWMRLGGTAKLTGKALQSAIVYGKAFGLSPEETTAYIEARSRTRYTPNIPTDKAESEKIMSEMVQNAKRAGMGGVRLPEFIEQYAGALSNVLTTAITADPNRMAGITADFAKLGEPFRGQRGVGVMGRLNQAISGGGGVAVEAARRILIEREELVTPAAIQRQIEKGIYDPDNLRSNLDVYEQMAGGNRETATLMMSRGTGLKMKEIYNPDKYQNSIMEMIRNEGIPLPDISKITGVGVEDQVSLYEETYGRKQEQYNAALVATKMEDASGMFAGAVDKFNNFMTDFLTDGITIKIEIEETVGSDLPWYVDPLRDPNRKYVKTFLIP